MPRRDDLYPITARDLGPTRNSPLTFEIRYGWRYTRYSVEWEEYLTHTHDLRTELLFLTPLGTLDTGSRFLDPETMWLALRTDHPGRVTNRHRERAAEVLNQLQFRRRRPRPWRLFSPSRTLRERAEFVPINRNQHPPDLPMSQHTRVHELSVASSRSHQSSAAAPQ